jgi:hypothetical protein
VEIGKQPGVGLKSIGCSKDITGAAEFDQDVACFDDAGNISRSNMIGTAGDNRRTFGKPSGRRRLPAAILSIAPHFSVSISAALRQCR